VTTYEIRYGKADVSVYRTYAEPLAGVREIPESPFRGRDNLLTAAQIEVVVHGTAFLDAYTRGDNRKVVATDTMKNFIHATSLTARARTLEMWLHEVGSAFLATYPQMERLSVHGRELPFPSALVPAPDGDGFAASDRLFSRDRCDHATASLDLERTSDGVRITGHSCGRRELQLIKITGSAFADFARDEHTTLPERRDRPLYIWCDIGWRYQDATDALGEDPARYVDAQQVADLAATVFHEFVSLSIQHLVHEIGERMLERWPQLTEVSFEAQNRLWDPGEERADDPRVRTYADPRPPFGRIGLVMRRDGG
jgi:urate oxidase / 2-oxo-4-hydroxy-4-carboxy-5-ureidoimidazoline decarboxylase